MTLAVHFSGPGNLDLGSTPVRLRKGALELKDGPYAFLDHLGADEKAFALLEKLLSRLKEPGDEATIKGFTAKLQEHHPI